MTPVIFMSDLYIAFGAEPWLVPEASDLSQRLMWISQLTPMGLNPICEMKQH